MWLSGYNEEGIPLKIDQMYEDISQEHANKTVTFEQHSSLSSRQCSVHPCKYVLTIMLLWNMLLHNNHYFQTCFRDEKVNRSSVWRRPRPWRARIHSSFPQIHSSRYTDNWIWLHKKFSLALDFLNSTFSQFNFLQSLILFILSLTIGIFKTVTWY